MHKGQYCLVTGLVNPVVFPALNGPWHNDGCTPYTKLQIGHIQIDSELRSLEPIYWMGG